MSAEAAADRARRLLEGTTPGPWRCDQYDVIPARTVSEGWLIADCGTSDSPDAADANARLIAAAPDLARDLIAESEAHEVTRRLLSGMTAMAKASSAQLHTTREQTRAALAALAAVERERDEARAELTAAWEETGRPSGCNTLAGAVRWAFRGRYNRDEMSQILGRREGETTAEAARRVVAELEGARAALGLAVADRDRTARVLSIRHEEIAQARAEVERQVSHGDAAQMGRDLDTASVPQLPTLLERVEAACTIIVGLRRHAADVDPLERERDEARAQVANLQSVIERVRPVVEALAGACAADRLDGGGALTDVHDLLIRMGRSGTSYAADAAWLRSLLPTAPDPAHRAQPAHTNGCLACGGTGRGLGDSPCDACWGGARCAVSPEIMLGTPGDPAAELASFYEFLDHEGAPPAPSGEWQFGRMTALVERLRAELAAAQASIATRQTTIDEAHTALDEAGVDREDDEGHVMPLWERIGDLVHWFHMARAAAARGEE